MVMVEKSPPDPAFEALLHYIQESRSLDFRGYKRTSLRRRLSLRMEAVGAQTFDAYQEHLEAAPSEFEDLLNTVLINVTSFFRDSEAWEVLKTQVIPDILANAEADRPIRVWSVGCASGEEPYSIAMLFAEALGVTVFCDRVKIYATDLDELALQAARLATYSPREVESVPPELLAKYFDKTSNHYVFQRELRKCVIFGRHNVVRDAPISRIDLLVCRNLLIYLETETQDIVLPRLHYALVPAGYLFLGKAETQLARSQLFRSTDMRHRIFTKVPQEWRRLANGPLGLNGDQQRPEPPPANSRLLEAVLDETTSAMLVIDDGGTVVLANAPARTLLGVGEADVGRPFQDLPISYRPMELRAPIEQVIRERRPLRLEHQPFHLSSSETLRLTIDVRCLLRSDGSFHAVLLSFTDTTRMFTLQQELESAQESLENSIEELQSANEELETTNEELQSTNEELETTNEELQSTNEELETINEESRSSNEEMESANEELRIQSEHAVTSRVYLESVLRSLEAGIVVLDDAQVVKSWNRWSENAWGLRSEEAIGVNFFALDIGLPVQLLRNDICGAPSHDGQPSEHVLEAVDRRGRPMTCSVRVSALQGEPDGGVVLVLEDVTEARRREEFTRRLGRVTGKALNEVYFLDPETFRFLLLNEGAEQKLGGTLAQLSRVSLADVMKGVSLADLKAFVAPLRSGEKDEAVFETEICSLQGEQYPAKICIQYFADESPPIYAAIVHDTSKLERLGSS